MCAARTGTRLAVRVASAPGRSRMNTGACKHARGMVYGAMSLLLSLAACSEGRESDPSGREAPVASTVSSFNASLRYQTPADVEPCSIDDIQRWVEHDMRDYYLYADSVPTLRLSDYTDADLLLRDLRVPPDVFSSLAETTTQVAQFEEGVFEGYGHWLFFTDAGELRFRDVVPGSPMEMAGVERGDVLLAVNGVAVQDLSDEDWNLINSRALGEPSLFRVQRGDEAPRDLSVARAAYATNTSDAVAIFDLADGSRVGYLRVRRFLDRTGGDVDAHLPWLRENGIDRLVLDMRYNGGGRSFQAERLAAQLLGDGFNGEPYLLYEFNERYAIDEFARSFQAPEETLPVRDIAILATGRTASASEALANGLRPYTNVVMVGSRTSGKPFASWRVDHCDLSLNAMRSITTNASGVSVLNGIAPDCFATDTWIHPTVSSEDGLTGAALAWFADGSCVSETSVVAQSARNRMPYVPEEATMFAVPASE